MRSILFTATLSIATMAFAAGAAADGCSTLQRVGTFCGTFIYSSGGTNQYTVTFGSGGAFNLNGDSPGTYTCYGRGFVEADYAFGGFENQVWYGHANATPTAMGHGKSTTNNYLYGWKLAQGSCPLARHVAPARSQREGK